MIIYWVGSPVGGDAFGLTIHPNKLRPLADAVGCCTEYYGSFKLRKRFNKILPKFGWEATYSVNSNLGGL